MTNPTKQFNKLTLTSASDCPFGGFKGAIHNNLLRESVDDNNIIILHASPPTVTLISSSSTESKFVPYREVNRQIIIITAVWARQRVTCENYWYYLGS